MNLPSCGAGDARDLRAQRNNFDEAPFGEKSRTFGRSAPIARQVFRGEAGGRWIRVGPHEIPSRDSSSIPTSQEVAQSRAASRADGENLRRPEPDP